MKSKTRTTTFTASVLTSGIFVACLLLTGCRPCVTGTGNVMQESRDLEAFNAVVLDCAADVFISQNRYPPTATIKAQQNILDMLELRIENGKLFIGTESCFNTSEALEVYLNTREVEALVLNGSGGIHTLTDLKGQALSIDVNGSGDVTAEVDYRLLTVGVSGSGDVRLGGMADRLEVSVSGSGSVKGPNMTCTSTSVQVSGSGDAYVNAEAFIEAHVSGSGDVKYTGFPQDTTFSVSGSGSIRSAYSR